MRTVQQYYDDNRDKILFDVRALEEYEKETIEASIHFYWEDMIKVIEDNKKIYAYRNSDKPLYDQMLDDYEPGMTQEKYDAFFDKVKKRLVPLIQKVVNVKQVETNFLFEEYPIEEQKAFSKDLLKNEKETIKQRDIDREMKKSLKERF